MPDVGAGAYLIEALFEAGPTLHDSMGEKPLGWLDLDAYGRATQAITEPWEYRALRDMSRAYLGERQAGVEPLAIAPADQD